MLKKREREETFSSEILKVSYSIFSQVALQKKKKKPVLMFCVANLATVL